MDDSDLFIFASIRLPESLRETLRAGVILATGRVRPIGGRGLLELTHDLFSGRTHPMNILLWALQILTALLFGASGIMKVFMFDKVSKDVPSFGALPRNAWTALGILELICVVGLIVPSALPWDPKLTVVAATILAIESLVFIGVHVKYRELTPIIMSAVLGLLMAFIAYGRLVLQPI